MAALSSLVAVVTSCGESHASRRPLAVARAERVWVDETRVTPPTLVFRGAPTRTLRTLLWVPEVDRPSPLLLMAHGYGGLAEKFEAFASCVASSGYLVAAPTFPLTNQNAPISHIPGLPDYLNQPADVSFVLDRLLEANRTDGDELQGRIAESALVLLGHSLGGTTAIGVTRKACCTDPRFLASVLVSSVWPLHVGWGSDVIAPSAHPTLEIHGTQDETIPYLLAAPLYERLGPPRWFLSITGGRHAEGLESQAEPPVRDRDVMQRAVLALLGEVTAGQSGMLDETLDALAAEGHPSIRDPG